MEEMDVYNPKNRWRRWMHIIPRIDGVEPYMKKGNKDFILKYLNRRHH
jgi:hypothetical protein